MCVCVHTHAYACICAYRQKEHWHNLLSNYIIVNTVVIQNITVTMVWSTVVVYGTLTPAGVYMHT